MDIITLSNHTLDTDMTKFIQIKKIIKENIPPLKENILIQDHSEEFSNLMEKTDRIIQKNNREKDWEKIRNYHENNIGNTVQLTLCMFLTIILIITFTFGYAYYKFYNLSTWIHLRKTLNAKNPAVVTEIILQKKEEENQEFYQKNSEFDSLTDETNP